MLVKSKKYQSGTRFELARATLPLLSFAELVSHKYFPVLLKSSALSSITPRRNERGTPSATTKEANPFFALSPWVWTQDQ
jgi:hypothetical protein